MLTNEDLHVEEQEVGRLSKLVYQVKGGGDCVGTNDHIHADKPRSPRGRTRGWTFYTPLSYFILSGQGWGGLGGVVWCGVGGVSGKESARSE